MAPIAAAVVLALGTGYRQDIGTLWLPVLIVILWHHRWKRAALAGVLFTALTWRGCWPCCTKRAAGRVIARPAQTSPTMRGS